VGQRRGFKPQSQRVSRSGEKRRGTRYHFSSSPDRAAVTVEKAADDLQIIPAKKPASSLKKIKGMKPDVDLLAELLADRRRR
jgi:hypothetical protein